MLVNLIKSITGRSQKTAPEDGGVYVCLAGGLGNQLFQYAFARFLSTQGVAVDGLVTNLFQQDQYSRAPLVPALSRIPAAHLTKDQLAVFKIVANDNGTVILDAVRQRGQTGVVCQGYWQQPDYANAVAAELAGDLKAYGERVPPAGNITADCVLHVRRHDYGHLGLLPLAYYQAALAHCGSPRFAVVTDEPNFCEYVFSGVTGFAGVVRGDSADPWSDFFLMAGSRIQIIANSSFSWWTAWLGRATGKTAMVIAPSAWSLIKDGNPCPGEWHRIDTALARP